MEQMDQANPTKELIRVLVVEHNDTLRKLYEQVLTKFNHLVYAVSNSEKALECLPTFAPNVVLASSTLPNHGLEHLSERIRSFSSVNNIPIICTTACLNQVNISDAQTAGVSHLLRLPFEYSDLQELISQVGNKSTRLGELSRKEFGQLSTGFYYGMLATALCRYV